MGRQVVGPAQFLLQQLIVWWRKRPWQILRLWRKILATNQAGSNGMTVDSQIVQQAADAEQIGRTGFVGQGRLWFTQQTEPAEQMGIAAELAQPAHLRKGRAKKGQEAANAATITDYSARTQGQGESLDVRFQDLFEAESGLAHTICEESKRVRFSTARAYSLQTSFWGELDVEHRGADLRMTHEMLESGQGDAGAHHIRSEGMPKPMGIGLGNLATGAMMAEQGAESGRGHGLTWFQANNPPLEQGSNRCGKAAPILRP